MEKILDTSTLFLSICKYQSYDYTWPIAEDIRRASAGGMRSTPTSQTLRQQLTIKWRWCVL